MKKFHQSERRKTTKRAVVLFMNQKLEHKDFFYYEKYTSLWLNQSHIQNWSKITGQIINFLYYLTDDMVDHNSIMGCNAPEQTIDFNAPFRATFSKVCV